MSTTATRPKTTVAIAQASNQGTASRPKDGCKDCVKTGLAILPLIPTVAPKALRGKTAELKDLDDRFDSGSLSEHWYVLRTLQTGFLYVLSEGDKSWDGYVVDSAGLLRRTAVGKMPANASETQPMSEACKRTGDNVPAQVIAIDPEKHPKVWMAYSRYRWTQAVLDDYAADKDGCRTKRMTPLDVTAAAANNLGKGKAVQNGAAMSVRVGSYAADYASSATRAELNKYLAEPLQGRFEQVAPLATKMAEISKHTAGKTGCMIVLDDTVGITAQLNSNRNRTAADAAQAAGIGDAERARRRVVADVIEGIRLNAAEHPGPWWDKNYGPERFLKHIDQAAWKTAHDESTLFKSLTQQVEALSKDYVFAKESAPWKAVQHYDFDPLDAQSALNHRDMVVLSVAGSGITKVEREQVWYASMQRAIDDPDNWLERALLALHTDLIGYVAADQKEDKAYDTVKGASAITKEWTGEGLKQLSRFYSAIRQSRGANDAMAAIIESSAALMYRLSTDNPKAYHKLVRSVTVSLITTADLAPQPVVVKGAWQKIIAYIQDIATGQARLTMGVPAQTAGGVSRGAYLATKGNLGAKGWQLSQAMDGAVLLDKPGTKQEMGEVVAWVITKLQSGEQLDTKTLSKLGLRNVDVSAPAPSSAFNPFLENHVKRMSARGDAILGAGAIFFQVQAFINAQKEYQKSPVQGGVGMLTAVLSATSAGLEITAAVQVLRGQRALAVAPAVWAARFSLAAGLVEGVYLVAKGGYKTFSTRDQDSGLWTIGSGVFVAAAGVASYGAGMAAASALAGGAGTATVLGLSMGPVGWALLAVALIGAAIYFTWQAWATDDENLLPVEYWLDNGTFGKREFVSGDKAEKNPYAIGTPKVASTFSGAGAELLELQRIFLIAQGRVSQASDRHGIGLLVQYEVAVPRYVAGSKVEITFTAIDEGKRFNIGLIVCEDGNAKPSKAFIEPRLTGMREGPTLKLDEKTGALRVEGYFATMRDQGFAYWIAEKLGSKDTNVYADKVEMSVLYEPDRLNLPQITSSLKDLS
jgi:hypothetical protein